MRTLSLLRFCACATLLSSVSAFSVSFTTPTQCGEFTVSWVGGQAPFYVLLTPKFHPLYNDTVPSSAFTNGQGSYSISQLPLPSGEEFLLTMSDSSGFNTGGTTTLLTVGDPVSGNNCNLNATQDFTFQLPSALKQCALFNFTSYDLAVLPVTITGLIPGGTFFQYQTNESSYSWIANIEEGTDLLFFMTDSQNRQGGVSDLTTVAASTDNSCLVVGSPSSTMPSSQPTSTPTASPSSKTSKVGIIAGSTVGGVAFLVLLIILGICCQRRASRSSNVASSLQRQLSGVRRKDDTHEVGPDGHVQPILPVNHVLPPPPPRSQSHLANASASNPFSQHLPQMSYTNSVTGSSSISSASRQMATMGGHTAPPNTFSYQTLPVGLAPPIHPGTYSHLANVSAGNFAVNDPHAQFSQIQPSRLSSNLDSFTGYGDPSRQMAMAGKPASQMYSFPYQTHPVNHPVPLTQPESLSHHMPSRSVSDPPSLINTTQPLRLGSNIGRFAKPGSSSSGGRMTAAATQTESTSSTQVLLHTDSEDVSAARDAQDRVELPPQYADRQPFASQPASALK